MSAWRWFGCAALICALAACGDDDSGGDDTPILTQNDASATDDAGPDADVDTMPPPGHPHDSGVKRRDSSVEDSGPDAPYNPFDYDAEYHDPSDFDAGPPPDEWSCPKALWNDGYCDCGCSARDVDCQQFSCTDPGCIADTCAACFAKNGSWQSCSAAPNDDDWTCDPGLMGDGTCDCGCGIPDPDCQGQGCTEPGCRKPKCQTRSGCEPGLTTDSNDDCSSVNPSNKWTCAWDHYGAEDGCDCGCGAIDPDCGGLGCTSARCYTSTCDSCFDEDGRPYSCDAAQAGWDDDIVEATQAKDYSLCSSQHFDANDGCDCGCGGIDPDCGSGGCEAPGCNEDKCDRCTDLNTLQSVGCAPQEWLTAGCDPKHYGTGDGCDCGCGWKDPDCDDNYCTTAGCQDGDSCDVCWDNGDVANASAMTVKCPGWTCQGDEFTSDECDCGCGKVDPRCRDTDRVSCTEPDCETAACEMCDQDGERVPCGGEWPKDVWPLRFYGIDGLCDCGAGAPDPDCGKKEGCSESGCLAKGCEVCHTGSQLAVCFEWTCDDKSFGKDDGCDCGCGAPDPDCETGRGCTEPGCTDKRVDDDKNACDTCHDPYGRAVACP